MAVIYDTKNEKSTDISLIDSKEMSLQRIFAHMTGDPHFLVTIIRTQNTKSSATAGNNHPAHNSHNSYNSHNSHGRPTLGREMSDFDKQARSQFLSQRQTQDFAFFPEKLKEILPSDLFIRKGVRNRIERVVNVRQNDPSSKTKFKMVSVKRNVNVSLLSSLNMILRKDCQEANELDQDLFLDALEKFVADKITRNFYHIDKDINTKSMQNKNKIVLELMESESISENLIQIIINIFELNLLIYDVTNDRCYFYWARGKKYPHVNLFNNIIFMTRTDGIYEPVLPLEPLTLDAYQQTYAKILTDERIQAVPEIEMHLQNYEYIMSWGDNITGSEYGYIYEKYFDALIQDPDENIL
jgi:hypothetical protein